MAILNEGIKEECWPMSPPDFQPEIQLWVYGDGDPDLVWSPNLHEFVLRPRDDDDRPDIGGEGG